MKEKKGRGDSGGRGGECGGFGRERGGVCREGDGREGEEEEEEEEPMLKTLVLSGCHQVTDVGLR